MTLRSAQAAKGRPLLPLHVVYKSDRFGNGCLTATSVTHMGSQAIKPRLDTHGKGALKTNLLDLFLRASSSDQNSVGTGTPEREQRAHGSYYASQSTTSGLLAVNRRRGLYILARGQRPAIPALMPLRLFC